MPNGDWCNKYGDIHEARCLKKQYVGAAFRTILAYNPWITWGAVFFFPAILEMQYNIENINRIEQNRYKSLVVL